MQLQLLDGRNYGMCTGQPARAALTMDAIVQQSVAGCMRKRHSSQQEAAGPFPKPCFDTSLRPPRPPKHAIVFNRSSRSGPLRGRL